MAEARSISTSPNGPAQSPLYDPELADGAVIETVWWQTARTIRLAFFCSGVVLALGLYGVQQERLMAMPYGEAALAEFFSCSLFLVFLNRTGAVFFAAGMAAWNQELLTPAAPLWKYAAVSCSNVAATTCQYEALKFVSFPVQMLGKSSKMLPVMAWGIMLHGKKYTVRDFLVALAVTGGCALFLTSGDVASSRHAGAPVYGLMLMVAFLAADGFTSSFQEHIFRDHHCSTYNQMFFSNLCSGGFAGGMLYASGGFAESFAFAHRHPAFVMDAALLTLSGSVGQWFIYSTIYWFDALTLAATMNARQLCSIVVSIKFYHHPVTTLQVLGMGLAFAGLGWKSFHMPPARKH